MRLKKKSDRRRNGFNERAELYTLSQAKAYLGRLTDLVLKGKPVYIIRGPHRFALQEVRAIEPIPLRPIGYFEYDEQDLALDKKFASANVLPKSATL